MEKFVCAFRGRRDSYQVPLGLAEAELLDQFITDAYALPWVDAISGIAPAVVRAAPDPPTRGARSASGRSASAGRAWPRYAPRSSAAPG